MKLPYKNLLILVFLGCSASYCRFNFKPILSSFQNSDFNISPTPIYVKNEKIKFELTVVMPTNKHVNDLDSINYILRIKDPQNNYYELCNSVCVIEKPIKAFGNIIHHDTIRTSAEFEGDTLQLLVSRRMHKGGISLNTMEFRIGTIINE